VTPVAFSTTKHNKAALGHAKLTQGPMPAERNAAGDPARTQTQEVQLNAIKSYEETIDQPEDAVTDLVLVFPLPRPVS
jgi:hypothetical protein